MIKEIDLIEQLFFQQIKQLTLKSTRTDTILRDCGVEYWGELEK